jgi:glycine hydroxymethyltransferase
VQPHSGSQANQAVFLAALNPGDPILGLHLDHGGHLSHGKSVNVSGKWFKAFHYTLDPKTERIDMAEVRRLARECKPKLIITGASAYPRLWDFAAFAEIAHEVGAVQMADIAHFAGLVATGLHPSPVPHSEFVTTTTHKTLRGPRGGLILCREEYAKKVNSLIFPGIQGGPLMHVIAGKAVAFQEALQPEFKSYQAQVIRNAQKLASVLGGRGYQAVSGGTDNHLFLLDLGEKVTGKEAEEALGNANITVNKNAVPFDVRPPAVTSGIRIGTPAATTRGFAEPEMEILGTAIADVLDAHADAAAVNNVQSRIVDLCRRFPVYG